MQRETATPTGFPVCMRHNDWRLVGWLMFKWLPCFVDHENRSASVLHAATHALMVLVASSGPGGLSVLAQEGGQRTWPPGSGLCLKGVLGCNGSGCNVRIRLKPRLLPTAFPAYCPLYEPIVRTANVLSARGCWGGGVWDPKIWSTKNVQTNLSFSKFHFPPLKNCGEGGVQGGNTIGISNIKAQA